MNDLVSELIYNALSTGQGVDLPGIGMLEVEYRSARMKGRRRLLPPRARVVLKLQRPIDIPSVIDMIEVQTGDRRHAEAIYGAWIEDSGARRSGVVEIERVGTIRQGDFTIAPQLDGMLNPPEAANPVRLRPRPFYGWGVWICVVLAVAALLWAGWHYRAQIGSCARSIGQAWTGIEWPSFSLFKKRAPQPVAIDSTIFVADSLVADSLAVDSLTAESVATQVVPAAEAGRYHLIVGMYSTRANAEAAVWRLARQESALECTIVVRGSRYLVSVFSSSSEQAVQKRQSELGTRHPEAWIWKE